MHDEAKVMYENDEANMVVSWEILFTHGASCGGCWRMGGHWRQGWTEVGMATECGWRLGEKLDTLEQLRTKVREIDRKDRRKCGRQNEGRVMIEL